MILDISSIYPDFRYIILDILNIYHDFRYIIIDYWWFDLLFLRFRFGIQRDLREHLPVFVFSRGPTHEIFATVRTARCERVPWWFMVPLRMDTNGMYIYIYVHILIYIYRYIHIHIHIHIHILMGILILFSF
jgi:hypothetical protein